MVRDDDGNVIVMPAPISDVWRKQFEQWISSPPFEKSVARNVDDSSRSVWPGSYRWIEVELAWQAWLEAKQSEA